MKSSLSQASLPTASDSAKRWTVTVLWLLGYLSVASAGSLTSGDVDFVLLPDSKRIHYAEVYVKAPGFIDLYDLEFSAMDTTSLTTTMKAKSTKIDITVTRLPDRCRNRTNIDRATCLIL